MNRETVEARKAHMEAQRAKNLQDLQAARERVTYLQAVDNTIHGVIQDCDHWLDQLPPADQASNPPATPLLEVLAGRKAKREGVSA